MLKKAFYIVVIVLLIVNVSHSQVPQLINYQAMLTDATDNPISGIRSIKFSIYDAATEGTVLWDETQTVTITDGIFNVLLGSIKPIPYSVFDGNDRYLALKVATDPEMTPRKRSGWR